ncbi:hypothetical protein [Streptomyces formicae]|uniref:Uncharacterized protein n=1 Tax=Streptomyces formicae TaxID=1616117 RepID=A0A291QAM6_9ACTN|nr:hypothetical protein [Streptomyces formicae]ATL28504.1 hypothetical protein KY5_3486 [Streptomyces formicae]
MRRTRAERRTPLTSHPYHQPTTGRPSTPDNTTPRTLPADPLTTAPTATTLHTHRREYTLITRSGATA